MQGGRCLAGGLWHNAGLVIMGRALGYYPQSRRNMTQELQVVDLLVGEGKAAVKGALIKTHYTGWLEDGTQFESSHDKGKPFQCVIGTGRVIKGWDLGLIGMRVGGKRRLVVPAQLAYGERQVGTRIPPHANLTFEIELLEVLTRDD